MTLMPWRRNGFIEKREVFTRELLERRLQSNFRVNEENCQESDGPASRALTYSQSADHNVP